MSTTKTSSCAAAVLLAVIALLTPRTASAHHGWAGYLEADFEISGTVEVPVSLAGPHAMLTIKGTDGHIWTLVLAPPPLMAQVGLRDGMIPVGSKVTARGHRHKDSDRYEVKTERLTWAGKTYTVYPGRE